MSEPPDYMLAMRKITHLLIDDFLPSEVRCAEFLRGVRGGDGFECV